MNQICIHSLVAQRASCISNRIRRIDQLAVAKAEPGPIFDRLPTLTVTPSCLSMSLISIPRLKPRRESREAARVRPNRRRIRRQVILLCICNRIRAGPVAKVRGLIHVNPQSIYIYSSLGVEEQSKLVDPVVRSIRMEPVGEDSWTGPDGACKKWSVYALYIIIQGVYLYTMNHPGSA